MILQDELERVECAEDIFALFGLAFDPKVLAMHRLHVIKRFGRHVAEIDAESPPLDDDTRWNRYATALKRAHDYYSAGTPTGEHEFLGVQQGLLKLTRPHRKG